MSHLMSSSCLPAWFLKEDQILVKYSRLQEEGALGPLSLQIILENLGADLTWLIVWALACLSGAFIWR